jgi:hypothetical protein
LNTGQKKKKKNRCIVFMPPWSQVERHRYPTSSTTTAIHTEDQLDLHSYLYDKGLGGLTGYEKRAAILPQLQQRSSTALLGRSSYEMGPGYPAVVGPGYSRGGYVEAAEANLRAILGTGEH